MKTSEEGQRCEQYGALWEVEPEQQDGARTVEELGCQSWEGWVL